MKKQVLSVVLGLAVTAAAGTSFAAGADNRFETLKQGDSIGQRIQDKILSVPDGEDYILNGENSAGYEMLEEGDELTGSAVEDKVLNAEESLSTENNNASEGYEVFEETDKLTGNDVKDEVLNEEGASIEKIDSSEGYATLGENDKLSEDIVEDKVIN